MRFVYILEDDPKFQNEICEAISFFDPKIQVRIFPKLENFVGWLRLMMTTGPKAIALGGEIPTSITQEPVTEGEEHQLVMVLSKIEFLGVRQLGLMRKTRELFIQRKICTREDPTAFVLTAHDDPAFKIQELEDRILNNVIFKPFDRLILIQHLTFAIDGRHPPSKYTIANQKTTAIVEMLKDADLEAISEVGMITTSNREIAVGSIAKYYGSAFITPRHKSMIAICQRCEPHPTRPDTFRCFFMYFAADPTQLTNLRKLVRDKKATPYPLDWKALNKEKAPDRINVILLDEEEEGPQGLQPAFEKRFEGVKIMPFASFSVFLADLDPEINAKSKDVPVKALGGANMVTLRFDAAGATFLGFESDKQDLAMIFETPEAELKGKANWFIQAIQADQRERYRAILHSGKVVDDGIFLMTIKDLPFYIRVLEVTKEPKKLSVKITELSKQEQNDWLAKNSRLKDPVHLIIASHRFFGEGAEERWTNVREVCEKRFGIKPAVIMIARKEYTDEEERQMAGYTTDIFFKPIDRSSFFQKIKTLFPRNFEKGEKVEIPTIEKIETIKVATPVKVSEFSEAGFIMQYYRSISVGSFREIVLWQPYEIGAPELLATCNFVDDSQKDIFNCHFVFFGINDHFLRHIRVWIRDNYILGKEPPA